ncbi:hypothetical protein K1W54_29800 [Micromonospora sp. CPCC 205371]|nr:hypothetical protein [Micromonospora sp. CPCC 205371]
MTETATIPTLTTVEDAHAMLRELAETHDWVSVFWDRGWGDSGQPLEISIIVDGNGQQPLAWITADVYRALLDQGIIPANTLKTFKARKLHNYKIEESEPEPAPTSNDIAEKVIRDLMRAHPEWPIRAEFYRGLDPTSRTPRVMHEIVENDRHPDGRRVLILPAAREVAVSAQERDILGYDIIGGGRAQVVSYPRFGDEVDLDALQSDGFRAELVAVIEAKLTDIETARAKG